MSLKKSFKNKMFVKIKIKNFVSFQQKVVNSELKSKIYIKIF